MSNCSVIVFRIESALAGDCTSDGNMVTLVTMVGSTLELMCQNFPSKDADT